MAKHLLITPHGYYLRVSVPKDLRQTLGKREIKKTLSTFNHSHAIKAAQLLTNQIEQLFLSLRGVDMSRYRKTGLPGLTEVIVRELDANGKPFREREMTVEEHRQLYPVFSTSPAAGVVATADPSSALLPTAVACDTLKIRIEELIAEKKDKVSSQRLRALQCSYRHLLDFFGDVPMSSVTRKQAKEFIDVLSAIPAISSSGRTKRYVGMSLREIATHTQEQIEKNNRRRKPNQEIALLDPSTINKHISDAESLWDWCHLQDRSLSNPFAKQKLTIKGRNKRDPFTAEHLDAIFHDSIFTEHESTYTLYPHHFFVPLIGAYTGMRIEEICQLHLDDVRRINDYWVFDVNKDQDKKLKNDSSIRLIPIHPDLKFFGLLQYADELRQEGETQLFPNLLVKPSETTGEIQRSNTTTVWFGRLLIKLDIKTKSLVFHSFRHTFANAYKQRLYNESVVKELLGHAQGNITQGTYGSAYHLKTLHDAIITFNPGMDAVNPGIDLKAFVKPWEPKNFALAAAQRRLRRKAKDPYLTISIADLRTAANIGKPKKLVRTAVLQ